MRETLQINDIGNRRERFKNIFCRDLMNTLFYPRSSQNVITWIDNIFTKLRRFIRNQSKISNNDEFQKNVFIDVCTFLNSLNSNFSVRKVHNTISKTSIDEYKDMTLWEQFYNNTYEEIRDFDYDCKWWSCSYRTLTLFKFFDALREAGLDIKLSMYRLKNTDDNFVGLVSWRHSWVVVNFRWVDYMIDYEWINDIFSWRLIQSVNVLKYDVRNFGINDSEKLDELKIENRRKSSSREKGVNLVHFKTTEDFLEDVKNFPELRKISFITYELKAWEPTRLDYQFFNWGVYIEVDDYQRVFVLKKDVNLKKDKNWFMKSLVDNVEVVKDEYWEKRVSQADKEELAMLLWMVEKDINLDVVISEYN
jgi:hypothetical protein